MQYEVLILFNKNKKLILTSRQKYSIQDHHPPPPLSLLNHINREGIHLHTSVHDDSYRTPLKQRDEMWIQAKKKTQLFISIRLPAIYPVRKQAKALTSLRKTLDSKLLRVRGFSHDEKKVGKWNHKGKLPFFQHVPSISSVGKYTYWLVFFKQNLKIKEKSWFSYIGDSIQKMEQNYSYTCTSVLAQLF